MKVEQAQKEQKEAEAAKVIWDTVARFQQQITPQACCRPGDTPFEAILDVYERDPERWDGLE